MIVTLLNAHTISDKKTKAIIAIKQIMGKLQMMTLGHFYFEVSIFLRNTIFISSLLYGTEALYNLSNKEIRELERKDEELLLKILDIQFTCPRYLLYLELGLEPVSVILKKRRILFLKHILDQNDESTSKQIYKLQKANPSKGDWAIQVKNDLKYFEIDLSGEK